MRKGNLEISLFSLRSASEREYMALNAFKNILRSEILPDDSPIAYEEHVQEWHASPEFIKESNWAAWSNSREQIAAFGEARVYETGDNEHLMEFYIEVLPEYRQQGLGRQLLRLIVEFSHDHHRHLMISSSNNKVPAGGEFLSRSSARKGLETHTNQLRIADLDHRVIQRWAKQSSHLSSEYDLGLWENYFPAERLDEIARLYQELANDQPRDTLEMEDMNFTPEILRQTERNVLAGGKKRWLLYVTDKIDNDIVGLTEVFWSPARPTVLNQGFTGVFSNYRNRGLGRWLKAEMLTKIVRELPEVEVIRTSNALSNASMVKINSEIGFKPYTSWAIWQVEIELVEKYLTLKTM